MIELKAIQSPSDPLLCFWLDLLQRQFPLNEQVSAGSVLAMVQEIGKNGQGDNYLYVALDFESKEPVAMTMFELSADTSAAILWYLAVAPGQEGHGYGGDLITQIRQNIFAERGYDLLFMEVESAAHANENETPEQKEERLSQIKKRNRFYIHRYGASQLLGINYEQQVANHEPVTMDILVMQNPTITPLSATDVFARGKLVFGDALKQTGELALSQKLT